MKQHVMLDHHHRRLINLDITMMYYYLGVEDQAVGGSASASSCLMKKCYVPVARLPVAVLMYVLLWHCVLF